ncbi:fibronectin type III domain-containing protein [Candidatus Dojkabacteria bacterium]|nr:fibronectin type III domain-containing protein [Candidatus Dojkabacteria bacterium]
MYISFETKRTLRTLGISLLVILALGAIVWGLLSVIKFKPGASPATTPQNVKLTDLSDTSVVLSWVTETDTTGYVIYGTTSDLSMFVRDRRDIIAGSLNQYTVHYVVLEDLDPETTYNYKIVSNSVEYGSGDNPYNFSTLPVTDLGLSAPSPLYGTVVNDPGRAAIVYVFLTDNSGANSATVSSITNEDGGWEVDLANLLTENGSGKFTFDGDTQVTISVQGGSLGVGRVVSTVGANVTALDVTLSASASLEQQQTNNTGTNTNANTNTDTDTDTNTNTGTTDNTNAGNTTNNSENQASNQSVNNTTQGSWSNLSQDISLSTSSALGTSSIVTGESSVKITNVTDTRFSVSWVTPVKVKGTVSYGSSGNSLNNTAYDERDTVASQGLYYTHHVTLTDLDIGGTYYIRVNSGTDRYFTPTARAVTLNQLSATPPALSLLNGSISGTGQNDTLVYATISDADSQGSGGSSQELSTVASATGGFTISLGEAYTTSGTSYYQSTNNDDVLVSMATYGDNDTQTVKVSAAETGTSFTLDSYGSSDGRSNKLLDMSVLKGSSPKTAGLITIIMSVATFIVSILLSSQLYIYNKKHAWENKIIDTLSE